MESDTGDLSPFGKVMRMGGVFEAGNRDVQAIEQKPRDHQHGGRKQSSWLSRTRCRSKRTKGATTPSTISNPNKRVSLEGWRK